MLMGGKMTLLAYGVDFGKVDANSDGWLFPNKLLTFVIGLLIF